MIFLPHSYLLFGTGGGGGTNFAFLLEGDQQSGTDYILLDGDQQSGTDLLLLEGDQTV